MFSVARQPPTATSVSAIVPTATGARFGIVTSKVRRAVSPSVSRIVAVTAAVPLATAVTVSI